MVRIDLYLVGYPTEVGSPFLESFDDGEELLVMDGIVKSRPLKFLREEGYRVQSPLVVPLTQLSADSVVRYIGFDFE